MMCVLSSRGGAILGTIKAEIGILSPANVCILMMPTGRLL